MSALDALLIVAAAVALAWSSLSARLLGRLGSFRTLGPTDGPPPADAPPVAAVVPAHNEEAHIARTVAALLGQDYPRLDVTIVDDRSADATGAILDDLAARPNLPGRSLRVIRGEERPEGWVGKTWAIAQGVDGIRAEWLLFVDADMGLHPRALAAAMAEARRAGADLVSLLPRAECTTFWQGAIAVSFSQLLAQLFPLGRVNDPARPEALAAGGFILVRRPAYEAAGGHEAVRGEILDDIRLAGRVKAAGGRLSVRPAPELAWTHMYGDLGAIWRGLRKNAYAGMEYQFHKFVVGAITALILAWAPAGALGAGVAGLIAGGPAAVPAALVGAGLWGWLAQAVASAPLCAFLRLPYAFGLTLPAGTSLYVAIATSSVWHYHRGRIIWKDRAFAVPPRPTAAGRAE